jgi:hypothetical protein
LDILIHWYTNSFGPFTTHVGQAYLKLSSPILSYYRLITWQHTHVLHPIITMYSSSNKKKVHYTSSTKGKSSHSKESKRSSRDSGVGSSSASDRASLGTSHDSPFDSQDLQHQRHNPSALSEALDAANDTILSLQEANEHLKSLLKEASKEKRSLKEEKLDLITEVESLGKELSDERRAHDKLRREVSGGKAITSKERERRPTPPTSHGRSDERSSHSSGSGSYHDDTGRRYIVPQAPPNNAPNPFTPLSERSAPSGQSVTYAPPATVTYSPVTYSTASTFANRPAPAGSRTSAGSYGTRDDGNYHSYPV